MKNKLFELKLKEQLVIIEDEHIMVRELTAGQASQYQNSLYKIVGNKPIVKTEDAEIKLVILTCYNEDGTKYFEANDFELLKDSPQWIVEKLYKVANKLNNPKVEELKKK